jgi:hypothetical protein
VVIASIPGAPEVRLERLRAEEIDAALGPEHGFYVRRLQTAELRLPVPVAPGRHLVDLVLGLAGVTDATYRESVEFV